MSRFMICANWRSGTTYMLFNLSRLSDVDADHELVFYPRDFTPSTLHASLPRGYQVARFLDGIAGRAPVKGSKLVLGYPHKNIHRLDVLTDFIDSFAGVKIVHIVRPYYDLLLSQTAGPVHDVAQVDGPPIMMRELTDKQMPAELEKPLAAREDFDHRTKLNELLFGDILIHELCRKHGHIRIGYPDLAARFPEVARFIGSHADANELQAIVDTPSTLPTRRGESEKLGDIEKVQAMASRYDDYKNKLLNSDHKLDDLLLFREKTVHFQVPR